MTQEKQSVWGFANETATSDEHPSPITRADLRKLRTKFRGTLLLPDDEAYAEVCRPLNLEVEWRPALVATCVGTADVMSAVKFAESHDLKVAVRGGGTGTVGASEDSVLVDTSRMKGLFVDPGSRTVRAQPGVAWHELDYETGEFGLATPGSQYSPVGVAGYALGGGHSWLARKYGWGSDNLVSVDLVTADGKFVTASEQENPELFWGLRGAGWNFGVVTSLTFRLHPVDTVVAGFTWYSADKIRDVMEFHREWAVTSMPDEVTTTLDVLPAPPGLPLPKHLRGAVLARIGVCYCGPPEQGEKTLRPMRKAVPADLDSIAPMRYRTLQAMAARGLPLGLHMRWRMHYMETLNDAVIDTTIEHTANVPPLSLMSIHHYGGAMNGVGEDATAMSHRDLHYNYMAMARWTAIEDGEPVKRWQDELLGALAPHATGKVYINYIFQEGPDRVRDAYNPRTWDRLVALKKQYDPDNVFSVNENIPPSS